MSRRVADPKADRAAQNQQTLKSLLKLEGNKVCADCKRNKHPRWASWNLGVFVCIRCSGIHRGMGTHISRVKSVDLDSWQDEQLQSILKWGNTRANKYWEAKLAPGHQPSEAKIENFIRTKYESKRWVMEGPMPDPSTLDAEGDENVPLNLVQEKAKLERAASQRAGSAPQQQGASQVRRAPHTLAVAASIDLFGDDSPIAPPIRPSTADIPDTKPTRAGPAAAAAPPPPQRQARQGESLLGLDFFGGPPSSNLGRPSSAASNPTTSRPDLKQSILSLYASAPKPQHPAQSVHDRQSSMGGMMSPPAAQNDPFGGMTDAFAGLSFPSTTASKSNQQPPQSAFSNLSSTNAFAPKSTPSVPQVTSPPPLSGGNFFDNVPAKPARQQPPASKANSSSNGLDFSFTHASTFTVAKPAIPDASNNLFASDEFSGFTAPSPAHPPVSPPAKVFSPIISSNPAPSGKTSSAFNLSAPTTKLAAAPVSGPSAATSTTSALFDPWSSGADSGGWGAPDPASVPKAPSQPAVDIGRLPSKIMANDVSGGWGSSISSSNRPSQAPTVTADEDFGGWTSASNSQTPVAGPAKTGGGFTSSTSDPFDNPWG